MNNIVTFVVHNVVHNAIHNTNKLWTSQLLKKVTILLWMALWMTKVTIRYYEQYCEWQKGHNIVNDKQLYS